MKNNTNNRLYYALELVHQDAINQRLRADRELKTGKPLAGWTIERHLEYWKKAYEAAALMENWTFVRMRHFRPD